MSETKDAIYIDIDDEITSIIDKVKASDHKIVALVLPKRATVLQSIVNMKLLKRRGDDVGKRVVLITSEKGLLPIAGAVGLHTAKTLQSKPSVPPPPEIPDAADDDIPEETSSDAEPELDGSKSVGELSGDTTEEETIDIDDDPSEKEAAAKSQKLSTLAGKKIKIPDFNSFRVRLFLGIGGFILLIIFWFLATHVMPNAKIIVKANTSTITVNPTFTVDTAVKEVNLEAGTSPAELKQFKKSDSEQVTASGQKDAGTKASGVVSLKNCSSSTSQVAIPVGSGVSSGGLTFITQEAVTLPASIFNGGGTCVTASKEVNVAAQQNGDKYNLSSGQSFTVAGYSNVSGTNSAAMSGGTSKIIKVVAQADIDDAKNKIVQKNQDEAKKNIFNEFQKTEQQGIVETFSSGTPTVKSTPGIGEEADTVTVSTDITFTMLGVKKDALKKFIEANTKTQVDIIKQPIQDHGLGSLSFQLLESKNPNQAKVTLDTEVITGVKLDVDGLKKQITGKKKGDVRQILASQTGVTEVDVHYSPFWVSKAPKPSKINIIVQQSTNAQQ